MTIDLQWSYCECLYTDEEIGLMLDTMGAHHFNFVSKEVGSGDHTITVTITGVRDPVTDVDDGDVIEAATIGLGPGSLTVEVVQGGNFPNQTIVIEDQNQG